MFSRKYIKPILVFIVVISAMILSCSRGEGPGGGGGGGPHVITDQDSIAPVVVIFTPTPDQVFSGGSSISMTGRITDETGLYQGSVKLVNDATGETVKNQQYEIHGFKSYDFTVTHAPAVTAETSFTVTVSFMDHGLNSTVQSVKVKVKP